MRCEMFGNSLAIYDCFKEKEIIKSNFSGLWNEKAKAWLIPFSTDALTRLRSCFGIALSDEVEEFYNKRKSIEEVIKKYDNEELEPDYTFDNYFKNCTLMKHQLIGATIAMELFNANYTGCLLSMEMGTGKTLTAMAILNRIIENKPQSKVLIVCPKISMAVWRDEFAKFEKDNYKLRIITGTPQKRIQAMNDICEDPDDRLNIVVINYEYTYAFESVLERWKPDIVICDESHRIKGVSTNQTKSITKIGKLCKHRICLTGTPLTNNILDFFSQFRFLDSSVFGLNYYSYKNKYVITGMFGEYLRPNRVTFDEFKQKVNSISFRRTKEQCLTLPEFTDVQIPVDISCKKMYQELEKDYITWLNETEFISVENALTKTLKLRQLTSGFYYDNDEHGNKAAVWVDTAKVDACMELIEQLIEEGQKVIVFAEFQAEIEKIKELCDKEKILADTYYGKTTDKKRLEIVNNFQNGNLQVFIGQIESAGISITLTSSSNMIFLSTGYKYGVYDQARARIHRKGQVNKCTYYHLLATNTIDTKIMKALERKEALASSIIDDYKKGRI